MDSDPSAVSRKSFFFFFFVINSCYCKRHMNIISKFPKPPLMMTISEKENEIGL